MWPASPLAIMTIRSYGITMIIYGTLVLLQGAERWNNPTYRAARALADQAWWGIATALCGTLILSGSIWATRTTSRIPHIVRNIGLYGTGVIVCTLAVTIAGSASMNPNVSFAGCALLVMVGVNAVIVSNAREAP